ncbi:phospholipid phosphatase-related protein type 2a isoform X2 [Phyllopteryx taeniolatus]|uniref:phospholipid phosphatase-related protein type 2a isoform X2 n=1 Tax=Phyllopteryx taeniolatus TaxID=161469 RepID=UPI002AD27194|nr:phospholipid phosphatase-related protein type 2a isoform X2 [Phyllopteryx taeniolatus]
MCNGGHYLTCTHITLQTRRSRAETNMALEEKPGVKSSGSIVPCFLFVELVIMAGTVLLAYYFEYTDTFPVHIQGFFCYDKTFSKPYPGPDNTSKIPPVLIYSLVSTLPTLTILAGELCAVFTKAEGTQEKTIVTADCCYFNPLLRRIIRFLGVYAFGLFTTSIFANAGQVVTGNQTPHFLSACRPNYTALGCQSSTQYITERRACTGHPLIVMSARKSFPSKDAALGVYSAAYTAMYVTLVFKTKGTRLTKPTVSFTLLCLAMIVGVVRVAEYRNHWADILAGFFTGGAIAVFLVTCVINSFQQTQPSPSAQRPQRPQSTPGMPMVTLPCVESPLEKFSGPQKTPRGSPFTEIT